MTTLVYIIGALSLHFTDISSHNSLYSVLLPLINFCFFVFLLWQIIFYMSINHFSFNGGYSFFTLISDIWDLNTDMRELGVLPAIFQLCLRLIDASCLFFAVYYYLTLSIELI